MGKYKYAWRRKIIEIAEAISVELGDLMGLPETRQDETLAKGAHDSLLQGKVSDALMCLRKASREESTRKETWGTLYESLMDNEKTRIKEELKAQNGNAAVYLFKELPNLVRAGIPFNFENDGDVLHISLSL